MSIIQHPHRVGNPAVPEDLKAFSQFVLWKLIQNPGDAKARKVPFNPATGQAASSTDPTTWGSYEQAVAAYQAGGYNGLGFVFTGADPFGFLDLDSCLDPVTRQWMPHAQWAQTLLTGATWETSQSGLGLHAIIRLENKAAFAASPRKWTDAAGNKNEFYITGRFIAFGHCNWTRLDLTTPCDAALMCIVPVKPAAATGAVDWDVPAPPVAEDAPLLARAMNDKRPGALFGSRASFAQLWSGDAVLGQFYSDPKRAFDNSGAEQALANALAWHTQGNAAQIERIMTSAPLCLRDKWQERQDYRRSTIESAVAAYAERKAKQKEENRKIGDDVGFSTLPTVLTLPESLDRFVFVGSGSNIVDRQTKTTRAAPDAVREFAASVHSFPTDKIDPATGLPVIKTKPVVSAWLANDKRQSVDVLAWAPGAAEFCNAPETSQAGTRAYNLWRGLHLLPAPANWQEWAQPFLDHVAYLVPDMKERQRFLQWLGHIFQKPGELPHTCYLMIATTTGVGRGTLASILTRALRGYVASNMDVAALFGGFNGRISQKLLATVDEVREGHSSDRYAKQESFKSKLTEETRALNPKYGAQSVEKNCCRWLLFSNHLDALPFDNSDRRVIVIENPSTRRSPEEYSYLHGLIEHPEFVASVQHYLATLDLIGFSAFEPAPLNAVKMRALASLASEADRAARQFQETWPDNFATVGDLKNFIGEDAPTNKPAAMGHIIDRAGMKSGHRFTLGGRKETLLIVRGSLTPGDLEKVSCHTLAEKINTARIQFSTL